MLEKKYIKLKLTGKTKDEILSELVEVLNEGGALEDKDEFLKVVKQREATSSTGLEEGIAIPHGKSRAVKKPAVAFGRSEGALLFLTRDITVLPTTVIGAAIGAAAATVLKVESMVPHGGMIILPLIDNKMGFLSALFIGVASTIFMLYFLKKGENNG